MLANIGLKIVLKISFFTLSRADVWFVEQEFVWKTYTAAEALPITRRVEIIDKKELAAAALNIDNITFVVYVAALIEPITISIYPSC